VLLKDSKTIVNHMHDYHVTCSYDPSQQVISNAKDGLVQVVVDYFDADIYSPNGKLSTHSLTMIIIQPINARHDTH
jgi:hypothetical protein